MKEKLNLLVENRFNPLWGYLFLFFIGVFINWHTFGGEPIFDDYAFLFESERFTGAPSAFSFWDPFTDYYRSWPLTFSLLWLVFKNFGLNFIVYKSINVFLHISISALIFNIALKEKIRCALFVGLIFLVHPAQVESISWIFQFKTLLSVFLFLLSYKFFSYSLQTADFKVIDRKTVLWLLLSILCFALSNKAKIMAIFFVFVFVWMIVRSVYKNYKEKKLIAFTPHIVFILLTLISSYQTGRDTVSGVEYEYVELIEKKIFETSAKGVVAEQESRLYFNNERQFSFSDPNDETPLNFYLKTISFYPAHFFLNLYNTILFPKDLFKTPLGSFYIVFGLLLVTIFSLFSIWKGMFSIPFYGFFIFLMGYLPVSGIEYVPYMKFSPVSDHWGYISYWGVSILLVFLVCEVLKRLKCDYIAPIILILITAGFSVKMVSYNKIFNDQILNLNWAIKNNPNEVSLKLALSEIYTRKGMDDLSLSVMMSIVNSDESALDVGLAEFLHEKYAKEGKSDLVWNILNLLAIEYVKIGSAGDLANVVKQMENGWNSRPEVKYYKGLIKFYKDEEIKSDDVF